MANFATHIGVGTVVAGGLATLTLAADVIAPENLVAVTMAGVLGSILPDIDLKESRPSKIMFSGLAVFFSFAVLFTFAMSRSIAELWIMWLGTMAFIRYGLHGVFHRYAVHRGVWHSVLAGLFCAIITAVVFRYVLGRHDGVSWLAAGFLFIGYCTHLILDEMYSVDIMDRRIKASFGTALKLYDRRYPAGTAGMMVATLLMAFMAPSIHPFVQGISSRDLWTELHAKLLPEEKWFGVIPVTRETAVAVDPDAVKAGAGNITTGSVLKEKPSSPSTGDNKAPAVEWSMPESKEAVPVTVPSTGPAAVTP